jgi:hypothetical protein
MTFRERLFRSLASVQPILDVPGVMVGGSQVPNLLEPNAAATLVVSQDVDLVIPVSAHGKVRDALAHIHGYEPSTDEPSVWLPDDPQRLEINFIGSDSRVHENAESYVLDDSKLPLLVFGLLSFLREGATIKVAGVRVRVPKPAGLLIEKLLTERSGLKGERDLLVALGLLIQCEDSDIREAQELFQQLPSDARTTVLSNLSVLSLMQAIPEMPDPAAGRDEVRALRKRLENLPK